MHVLPHNPTRLHLTALHFRQGTFDEQVLCGQMVSFAAAVTGLLELLIRPEHSFLGFFVFKDNVELDDLSLQRFLHFLQLLQYSVNLHFLLGRLFRIFLLPTSLSHQFSLFDFQRTLIGLL